MKWTWNLKHEHADNWKWDRYSIEGFWSEFEETQLWYEAGTAEYNECVFVKVFEISNVSSDEFEISMINYKFFKERTTNCILNWRQPGKLMHKNIIIHSGHIRNHINWHACISIERCRRVKQLAWILKRQAKWHRRDTRTHRHHVGRGAWLR